MLNTWEAIPNFSFPEKSTLNCFLVYRKCRFLLTLTQIRCISFNPYSFVRHLIIFFRITLFKLFQSSLSCCIQHRSFLNYARRWELGFASLFTHLRPRETTWLITLQALQSPKLSRASPRWSWDRNYDWHPISQGTPGVAFITSLTALYRHHPSSKGIVTLYFFSIDC